MRVKLKEIRDVAEWDSYAYAWRELQKLSKLEHPFLDFNWIRAWIERLPKDNIAPVLLVIEDDHGTVVGLLPFQIKQTPFFNQIEGIAQEFCDYIDWLLVPDLEREIGDAISSWLIAARHIYPLIRIKNIFPEGSAYRILKKYFPDAIVWNGVAPEIKITGTFDDYLKTLKPKFVNDTKRRERKIQHEVGLLSYVRINSNNEIADTVNIIARWHSQRMKEKNELSYFEKDAMKDHFITLYQWLNSLNMLHLSGLKIKDKYIALNVAFEYHNKIFSYTPVFDPKYAKYGVMRLLKLKHIEECYQRGIKSYDFCLGGEEYKFTFNPGVKQLHSLSLYGLNWKGKALEIFQRKLKTRLVKHTLLKKSLTKILQKLMLIWN